MLLAVTEDEIDVVEAPDGDGSLEQIAEQL